MVGVDCIAVADAADSASCCENGDEILDSFKCWQILTRWGTASC